MKYSKIRSYGKVNFALNVVGKRNHLHKIESIVSFLDLYDEILVKKINSRNHKVKFIGKFSKNIKSKNTITNLLSNLDKKNLLDYKYQIIVKKNIPTEAGLGGGSMNAANLLKYFIKKRLIKLEKKKILDITNSIGSDTILGIYSKSLILKSNNSIRTFSIKKKLFILIVKPNFGCSTKKIYSKIKKFSKPEFNFPKKKMFDIKFLKNTKNDLEPIAFDAYPKLKIIKKFLQKLSNCEFVRMTGSGSAIIAYYNSIKKSKDAEIKVKKKFRNYWCKISKTI